jgi:hypothetical protein
MIGLAENNELSGVCNEPAKPNPRYYAETYLEGLKKTTKRLGALSLQAEFSTMQAGWLP